MPCFFRVICFDGIKNDIRLHKSCNSCSWGSFPSLLSHCSSQQGVVDKCRKMPRYILPVMLQVTKLAFAEACYAANIVCWYTAVNSLGRVALPTQPTNIVCASCLPTRLRFAVVTGTQCEHSIVSIMQEVCSIVIFFLRAPEVSLKRLAFLITHLLLWLMLV